jgi:hypothetical protein
MVNLTYVASTLLMGLFLASVAVALARLGDRRVAPLPAGGAAGASSSGYGTLGALARRQSVWVVAFLLFATGVVAGVVLYLQGDAAAAGDAGFGLAAAAALALVGFLASGTYLTVRSRGRSTAEAIAVGLWALGLLLIAVVALNLVVLG